MVPPSLDPDRLLAAVRLDLEEAGTPSYVAAVLHADGSATPAPMIFARREPAQDAARRLARQVDEPVVVVAREMEGRRARFYIHDPEFAERFAVRLEVVERTLLQDDPMVGLL